MSDIKVDGWLLKGCSYTISIGEESAFLPDMGIM